MTKILRKTSVAILSFLFVSSTADVYASPGPYVSLEAGVATAASLFEFSDDGFAARVSGGYLFGGSNFNYGVEMGALVYPHLSGERCNLFSCSGTSVDSGFNIDLLAVAKYTFDSKFMLFAKAGPVYTRQWETAYDYYDTRRQNLGGIGGEVALGTGYQFTPSTAVTFAASLQVAGNPGDGIGALLIGINHSFL